jgi:hypothetical protein
MLQKNNDKKSKYIFIWFNFIDLETKVQIFLILIKNVKNFNYCYLLISF